MFIFKDRKNNGFITLIAMLVVSAIGITVAVSLLLTGVSSSKTAGAIEQSKQADILATACSNNALERIRKNNNFTGSGNLTLDSGACSYSVFDTGGETRSIDSTGTSGTVVRKQKIEVSDVSPKIIIMSWQEVADF